MKFYKTLLVARFLGFTGVGLFGVGLYYGYPFAWVYFQARDIFMGPDGNLDVYAALAIYQAGTYFYGSVAIVAVGVLMMVSSSMLGYVRQLWIRFATLEAANMMPTPNRADKGTSDFPSPELET